MMHLLVSSIASTKAAVLSTIEVGGAYALGGGDFPIFRTVIGFRCSGA